MSISAPPPLPPIDEERILAALTADPDNPNVYARYWFYVIGVNTLPQPTKSRDPAKFKDWKVWQNKPIPTELFEQWISEGKFRNAEGMAIIVGKVWRGKHEGKYLIFIDCDNRKAIEEFCTLNEKTAALVDIATKFIVEQHPDDLNRAHIYFYSEVPFISKASDANNHRMFTKQELEATNNPNAKAADELATKIEALPAYEVKGLAPHGMAFVTNSLHKNGQRYQIIGIFTPETLTKSTAEETMYHLDAICRKHGLAYLQNAIIATSTLSNGDLAATALKKNRALVPMVDLLREDYQVYVGHNRHLDLLRVMEHYLVVDPEHALEKSIEWNQKHCLPPLDDKEVRKQWNAAKNFIDRQNVIRTESNPAADPRTNMLPQAAVVVGEDLINAAMNMQKVLQDLGYCGCERISETEILVHYKDDKKIRVNFKSDRWEGAFEHQMKLIFAGSGAVKMKGEGEQIIAAGLSFLQEVYRVTLIQQRKMGQAETLNKFDMGKSETLRFSLTDVLKMGVNENDIQDSQPSKEVNVASLIRESKGRYVVPGIISSMTSPYRMVRGEIFECKNCLQKATLVYKRPDKDHPEDFKSAAEEMVKTAEQTNDAIFKQLHELTEVHAEIKCSRCRDNDTSAVMKFKDYDWVPTVDVEVRDPESIKNEMDGAFVKIMGDKETRDISIGEPVKITGKLEILKNRGKPNAVMFAERVEYIGREVIEVTEEDRQWIEGMIKEHGQNGIVDKLVEMYAPEIIGHELVKKGLLMVEAYAGPDITSRTTPKVGNYNRERKRIHASLVGPPGSAKTWLLKACVRHVVNSLYVSAQGVASGKSLTAIISKDERYGQYTIRHGPVALTREAICSINEIGRLDPEDQGHLLDAMEEGQFTKTAQGFHVDVRADSSVVVSANPKPDATARMKKDPNYKLTLDDVPYLRELIDRFDLFFVTRFATDDAGMDKYLDAKDEMEEKGMPPNYDDKIRKYIQYAKTFDPVLTKEARQPLKNAYKEMIEKGYGSPRVRNTLYRITKAIARLKLKKEADYSDAQEALQFYQVMIIEFSDVIIPTESDKDLVCRVMRGILQESQTPILFDTGEKNAPSLVDKACDRDKRVADYIGNLRYIEGNWKLRSVLDILRQETGRIMQVQDKPIALKWVGPPLDSSIQTAKDPSDASDASERRSDIQKTITDIFEGSVVSYIRDKSKAASEKNSDVNDQVSNATSDTSDSPSDTNNEGDSNNK